MSANVDRASVLATITADELRTVAETRTDLLGVMADIVLAPMFSADADTLRAFRRSTGVDESAPVQFQVRQPDL